MSGQAQFGVGEIDGGLVGGMRQLIAGLGNVDVIKTHGLVDQDRDPIGQRLHEAFTGRKLEPLRFALDDDVRADDAWLEGGEKWRVLGQDALFTLGGHRDNQLRSTVEDDLRGCNELKRDGVCHRLDGRSQLLRSLADFVNPALIKECLLGQIVHFAVEDLAERRDRILDLDVLARRPGKLLGHEERL